jgi:hypothetical protein
MSSAAAHAGPAKPLPDGFSIRKVYSTAKPSGYPEYVVDCPIHGAPKRLDRRKAVADFFAAHAMCK